MGQFMPSSLIPSTLTETYSVDATQALQFSCQINGTSPTTQYRLQIMQNNSSSTLVYDTNVVTLSTPLYPVDYNGNPNELVVTIPANTMQNNNNYTKIFEGYFNKEEERKKKEEEERKRKEEEIITRNAMSMSNGDTSSAYIPPEPSSKKSSGILSTIFSTLLAGAACAVILLTTNLGIGVAIATALSTFGITKSISKLFGIKRTTSTSNYNTSYQQNTSSQNKILEEAINCAFDNHDNENDNENNNNNNGNNNENENKKPDNSNNSKPKNLDALSGVGGDDNASQPPKTGDNSKPKGNTPDQTPNK